MIQTNKKCYLCQELHRKDPSHEVQRLIIVRGFNACRTCDAANGWEGVE